MKVYVLDYDNGLMFPVDGMAIQSNCECGSTVKYVPTQAGYFNKPAVKRYWQTDMYAHRINKPAEIAERRRRMAAIFPHAKQKKKALKPFDLKKFRGEAIFIEACNNRPWFMGLPKWYVRFHLRYFRQLL